MRQINVTSSWVAITEDNIEKIDWIINKDWKCLYTRNRLSSQFYVDLNWIVLKSSQFLFILFMEDIK